MKKIFTYLLVIVATSLSAQSQITWSAGVNIATSMYGNMHPRIALDASRSPMVIWGKMSDTSVYFSKWNGSMFTTPVRLNPAGMSVASAGWMGPDIASKGDTVYVVMKRMPEVSDTNHIYLIRSFDGGMTFSIPFRVDFIADSLSRFPTVTVDESGNPVVGFMKFNSLFAEARWVVTRSSDFGSTFSPDVKASGWSGGDVCDCCPGAILNSGNTVAMLYRDNLSNIRDSWAGISSDTGNAFSSGISIDANGWMLMSCPSSGPDGIIVSDTLYSVFMNGTSGTLCYQSKASLTGPSSVSVQLLTNTIPNLNLQNFPRIATDGVASAIVWKQSVNGIASLPILFTTNVHNGFPLAFDTVDLNNITNTDIAMSNGNVYVIWQDDNSGTVKFRQGAYTVPTGISEPPALNHFSVYPNPASKIISVQSDLQFSELRILDVIGKLYIHKVVSELEEGIDISELESGLYILQLRIGNRWLHSHFVKD